MARVVLASALSRWLPADPRSGEGERAFDVDARRLDQALECVFELHPTLRGYVLDERGVVRHHVAVFLDGDAIRDKARLDLALEPHSEVYLMQALSGG